MVMFCPDKEKEKKEETEQEGGRKKERNLLC